MNARRILVVDVMLQVANPLVCQGDVVNDRWVKQHGEERHIELVRGAVLGNRLWMPFASSRGEQRPQKYNSPPRSYPFQTTTTRHVDWPPFVDYSVLGVHTTH